MSVYNGDKPVWLRDAIESILNQTYRFFEFIIVLDGVARNDLLNTINFYKNKDNRILVISLDKNKGLGFALNKAIELSKGEYIIRMDADDISMPNRIEKLVNFMNSHPNIDVAGSFIKEFTNNTKFGTIIRYPITHDNMRRLFLRRNPLAHSSVIFRKSYFLKAGYYPLFSIRNEDTLLWLSGFKNDCIFSNIPDPLYLVRSHKETYMRRRGIKKSLSDFVDRIRVIIDLNGSFLDILYAFGVMIVSNLPYNLYRFFRLRIIQKNNEIITDD